MTVPVYREDLPARRVRRWHCETCEGTACEVTSDEGESPIVCPCGHMATWRLDRWRRR